MNPVWRELAVFPIVLGPAIPFYIWQFRAALRGRRADREETTQ